MLNFIDNILDRITMYKLMLYYLIILLVLAVFLGFFGILPYKPNEILISVTILVLVSWTANKIFSIVFNAPTNVESVYITSLILALIITPISTLHGAMFLVWAAILAMASKYILTLRKKHIFNPAAIAVVITAYSINQSASWWVGTAWMVPIIVLGGVLVIRKIQRGALMYSFFLMSLLSVIGFAILRNTDIIGALMKVIFDSSLFFFAFVMLSEPLTTPPGKNLQIMYGAIVGFLFVPQVHLGSLYSTPELALFTGNIFSYLVSPKQKLILYLKDKIQTAPDMMDLLFNRPKNFAFVPGQFMEWTLPHKHTDSRGNRRYFSIASSPTEDTIRLGLKFYPKGSSFKRSIASITEQTPIVGAQLAGEFTLPTDKDQKCVFIGGGIGITPFRSMLKYLLDTNERRSIILFYANNTADEIIYNDVFDRAWIQLGIKTIYTLTDQENIPQNWRGYVGRINKTMIEKEVPDFLDRKFYLSGPHMLVNNFQESLLSIGVQKGNIQVDFFPGFA